MAEGMLVNIKHLSISTSDRRLVTDLSMSVHGGDCLALIGPNGAGKSTLVNEIVNRSAITNHTDVKFLPYDRPNVSGVIDLRRDITVGYLPQVISGEWISNVDRTFRKPSVIHRLFAAFGLIFDSDVEFIP